MPPQAWSPPQILRPALRLALLLLLAAPATLVAQEEPMVDPLAQPHLSEAPVEYHSRQSLGQGVTIATLTNGLTVLVRENHAAPVATVRSYVKNTGSAYEGEYLGTGISHLVEHLVSGGSTTKLKELDIRAVVDSLGGKTNAFTSNDMTGYYIDCPAPRVGTAIELVADSMQHVEFDRREFARELGVVQRELEMGESERDRVAYQAMKSLVFTQHPMRHPIIGYLQVLQDVKRQDCIDFYENRYVPQNIVFAVAGDVETDDVLALVMKNFAEFRRTTEAAPVLGDEPDQASPRATTIRMPGETVSLNVAWPTVRLQHEDLYPLDVASYVLTNGDSSRLKKRLKIDEPLAISVSSASYTPGFVRGWFQISIEARPENVEACKRIVFEEIERLRRDPPAAAELAKVKRQKAAEHVFGQQTVQSQAESLVRSLLSSGDPLFDEQYVKGIEGVTADEVAAVVARYFRPERLNTVVIEPPGAAINVVVDEEQPVESPVIRTQLDNGLTVLVKRHAVLPMVTIQAFVNAGALSDTPQTSGRASLTAQLLERGTDKYTGEQIAEFFDSVGGSLTVGSQRNTSYVTATVLKDDYPTAFDHVEQVLFHPTFPADDFAKLQQLQLGRIAARANDPQTMMMDFWSGLLPPRDPYALPTGGTKESVASLTVDDLRQLHAERFVPANMVIAVYGDIDPAETVRMIEARMGSIPAGKRTAIEFPKSHQRESAIREIKEADLPGSALVMLGYPTVSIFEPHTKTTLDVLNGILTGGSGAGGRLFDELRGERLVYYVFGFQQTGYAPGYQMFLAQTRPETANEVVDRIKANIQRIADEGVTEGELLAVKEKLIAGNAMSRTTPSAQAFDAALNELYGLGYDYESGYDARIAAVTVEDLRAVARKYLDVPVVAIAGPKE
jgi:zinc protease